GAGMGSASADGASVLFGLNQLYDTPFTDDELEEIGLKVGADVPFAFVGGTKLVTGIGENLKELPSMPYCWFVIVTPDYSLPTVLAYHELDKQTVLWDNNEAQLLEALKTQNLYSAAESICNIFFKVCNYEKNVQLKSKLLNCGALNATLTGTGSSVYGIFDDYEKACYAKKQFERAYICEPCESSLQIE
ncbi:MAG: 4-(cytidine 5'-diphospho)-2-C-methyl-D-erythritol kinase, partial [Oscillospiraceae bacterium]